MPRGKKKEQPKPKYSKDEVQTGLSILHQEYFMQVIALSSYDPDLKELTFVKVPIETPEGGTYLVSILHVEGPKINLKQIAEQADEILAEKAKEEKKDVL